MLNDILVAKLWESRTAAMTRLKPACSQYTTTKLDAACSSHQLRPNEKRTRHTAVEPSDVNDTLYHVSVATRNSCSAACQKRGSAGRTHAETVHQHHKRPA
jgi:hypothetical protein